MKKLIKSIFRAFGIDVRKINQEQITLNKEEVFSDTMHYGLKRMKEKKIEPNTIIDLGAAQGRWSLEAMKFWSKAEYLLFEPLSERKDKLNNLKSVYNNFHIVNAAAGSETGEVNFSVADNLDGSGVYDNAENSRRVEVTTIDNEIRKLGLKSPYLIKFDTHGFEVPILEGAKETLKNTQLIVMECYGFRISKSSLMLNEMITYMEKVGFRLADVVDIMRRPGDDLFWQCDLFFLRSSNPFFQRTSYAE